MNVTAIQLIKLLYTKHHFNRVTGFGHHACVCHSYKCIFCCHWILCIVGNYCNYSCYWVIIEILRLLVMGQTRICLVFCVLPQAHKILLDFCVCKCIHVTETVCCSQESHICPYFSSDFSKSSFLI